MSDQVTEGGSGGGGAAAAAAAAAVTSASSSAVAAAGGSVESPRRGSVPIVEHDPHADRVKFAHESVTAREEQLLDESQKAFNVFLDWLLQHSAKFPDLYFKVYAPNVRGVHAAKPLPALYRFMEIPLKCLITDDMARSTPVGQRLREVEHELSVPNHCQIIVFMLLTRAEGNSFFQPYYDVLPSDFDNFPIFWGPEELSWLQGSSLVKQIHDRKHNMRSDYDHICKHIEEFRQFSFEDFLWCRTAVGSRNFSITIRGQKRTAMVPQADMLNHFRPRECSWTYDNVLQAFTMTSLKTIRNGAQVFDSYGKKCNSKFLLHYGFTIESNREADGICQNELQMTFQIAADDPLSQQRRTFINAKQTFAVTMNAGDDGTAACLNYLRVNCATSSELNAMASRFKMRGPISLANEAAAFRALAVAAEEQLDKFVATARRLRFLPPAMCLCCIVLMRLLPSSAVCDRYPTTIEEDDELLREGRLDPFSNRRHAVIIIRGEKEICHFFIRLSEVMQELLVPPHADASPTSDRRKQAERLARVNAEFTGKTDLDRFVRAVHHALTNKGL